MHAGQRGMIGRGKFMSQEEFKAMVEDLVAEEEKRLQVGSGDFLRHHHEIMELIGEAERYQKERRQRMERQFIGAKEVAEILGISISGGYAIIRRLNADLNEKGFITVRGRVSRAYFEEKLYGVHTAE